MQSDFNIPQQESQRERHVLCMALREKHSNSIMRVTELWERLADSAFLKHLGAFDFVVPWG